MISSNRRAVLVTGCVFAGCALVLGWIGLKPPRVSAKRQDAEAGAAESNLVRQGFPGRTADPNDLTRSDSAWEVKWEITQASNGGRPSRPPSSVLKINSAKYMYKDK